MSELAKRKKRDQKRKELRLSNEAAHNKLVNKIKSQMADARIRMVRTKDGIAFGFQSGLYGMDQAVVLPIPYIQIAGAVEDQNDLAGIITKVGLLVVSKLVKHNLAEGLDSLGTSIAKWAGVETKVKEDQEYTADDIAKANAALDAQKVTQALMAKNEETDDQTDEAV